MRKQPLDEILMLLEARRDKNPGEGIEPDALTTVISLFTIEG